MSDKRIQIQIAATGGDQAAAEARKVVPAVEAAVGSVAHLEKEMVEATKAFKSAVVGSDEFAVAAKRLEAAKTKLSEATKKVTSGNVSMSSSMQNVGYQVQDFAVQVGSGTSALRAFSQQAPQLLSAFGPWGVALGTLAAVGAPLAGHLLDQAGAAETLADRSNELGDAMEGAISKTVEMANEERIAGEERSAATGRARDHAEAIRDITRASDSYLDALREEIGLLNEKNAAANQIADAKGQREVEEASGDPVKQEEVRNRIRKEAQQRELSQLAEESKMKTDLMKRLIDQETAAHIKGENEEARLKRQADDAATAALEKEQLAALKKGEADALKASASKKKGPAAASANREAGKAQSIATKATEEAESLRNQEQDFRSQATDTAEATKKAATEAFNEANKLFKELAKIGREVETKKAVFAERDQAGDARVSRTAADIRKREDEKIAREALRKEKENLEDNLRAADGGLDATARTQGLRILGGLRRGTQNLSRRGKARSLRKETRQNSSGNDTLEKIGRMLSDGTNEAEIQKVGDLVREKQGELGQQTVAALKGVLEKLREQSDKMGIMQEQIRNIGRRSR